MTNKNISKISFILPALMVGCTSADKTVDNINSKTEARPNIIYILADDLGYGDVSAYNPDAKIKTANIDKLALQGMKFTNAHSPSSVSTPTRYGILTGRYCWRTKLKMSVLTGYDTHLISPDRRTVASMLKEEGYKTACIGKWHLGMDFPTTDGKPPFYNKNDSTTNVDWSGEIKNSPITNGFDHFFGIAPSLDMSPFIYIENDRFVGVADTIKTFKRSGPAERNFEAVNVMPDITKKAVEFIENQNDKTPFFLYFPLTAPHTPIVPTAEFQDSSRLHQYLDFVLQVDYTVGEIMKAVEKEGIAQNTIIILTSDNGFAHYVDKEKIMEKHGHFPYYRFRGYKADA